MDNNRTEIQKFYKNQSIFLTGGTGFVGKVLMAKLLTTCPDLKKIYFMVRPKKNKKPEQRLEECFDWACFDGVKSAYPNYIEKIALVEGDCDKPDLGICHQLQEVLKKEVTIVIHAAADVKFYQNLKNAVRSNVEAVKDILNLAKQMVQLKSFLYVSTAYSNAPQITIDEKFYKPPITPDNLIALTNILDEETLENITPYLIKKWPNVYTFTKSVAEDVLRMEKTSFPVAIVRPAIISSSYAEPLPGWVDNFYGVGGLSVGILWGVVRNFYFKKNVTLHLVPCDFVGNIIIATVWDQQRKKRFDLSDHKIYNYVGNSGLTRDSLKKIANTLIWESPLSKMIWYPKCSFVGYYLYHKIWYFYFQAIANIADFVLICLRKKPIAADKYRKLNNAVEAFFPFTTTKFEFNYNNVDNLWKNMANDDKKLFHFDLHNFDHFSYCKMGFEQGRVFMLNESPKDIPSNKKKLWMFFFLHYGVIMSFLYLVIRLLSTVFGSV